MNVDKMKNIMNVIQGLSCMRDDSVFPQNFNIYLAKTTTEDKRSSKLPTKPGDQPRYIPRVIGEISAPRKIPSQNRHTSKSVIPNSKRSKEIAAIIDKQSSKLKLSPEERKIIITTILASELGIRSKLDAQVQAIFSSPISDDTARKKTPSKRSNPDRDETPFQEKQPPLKSIPLTTINPFPSEQSKPKTTNDRQSKQSKHRIKRALTPIPEVSEVPGHGVENEGPKTKENLESVRAQERLRQQQMESDLDSSLIQDTVANMLLRSSDESDSLDELYIKDFIIRVAPSEPDASVSALPITEQALIETNKLATTIDSLKDRFQIKIARDKILAHHKPKIQVPKVINRKLITPPTEGRTTQRGTNPYIDSLQRYFKTNEKPTTKSAPPNIIDSDNWGEVALPEPIPYRKVTQSKNLMHASSDESFLSEKDMQFDDLFDMYNATPPPFVPNQQKLQQHESVDQRPQQTERIPIDSIENIEDFENPQLSDLPSDESDQTSPQKFKGMNVRVNENIENLEDPQLHSDSSDEIIADSAVVPPNNKFRNQVVPEQPQSKNKSADESQHQSDITLLKELLSSGALTSSITEQHFEEGVIDLLLRQSDSLWDPVVSGIPITYFIPSRNHEKGLLDTSINESNLDKPLIKSPQKKLPEYLESLENEWAVKTKVNVEPNIGSDMQDRGKLVDENQLIHGLPQFSYEPVPQYLFRRSVHNIMDSEDEPEDSLNILEDKEMNFDDFIDNIAEPSYDFKKTKLLEILEWKIKHLRELKRNCQLSKASAPPIDSNKTKRSAKLRELESETGPRDVFNKNHQYFNALFGIQENDLTRDKYVPSTDIELLHNKLPSIDSRIIRNVNNCQHHLVLMKLIYKKIYKYMSQLDQPESSKTSEKLEEIIKSFNQVIDGRICARIQACPVENSAINNVELLQNGRATIQNKRLTKVDAPKVPVKEVNAQKPAKISKKVSFAESTASSKTSKSEKTNTKHEGTKTVGRKKVEQENSVKPSSNAQKRTSRSETSGTDNGDFNEWTSLNISEVKDLIKQTRLAQTKYNGSMTDRANQRTVKASV